MQTKIEAYKPVTTFWLTISRDLNCLKFSDPNTELSYFFSRRDNCCALVINCPLNVQDWCQYYLQCICKQKFGSGLFNDRPEVNHTFPDLSGSKLSQLIHQFSQLKRDLNVCKCNNKCTLKAENCFYSSASFEASFCQN